MKVLPEPPKFLPVFVCLLIAVFSPAAICPLYGSEFDAIVYMPPAAGSSFSDSSEYLPAQHTAVFPRPAEAGSEAVPAATDVEVTGPTGELSAAHRIAVPPGRGGMMPDLELSYSSFKPNGWLGMGWDLNLGSIRRSTRNGLDLTSSDFELFERGVLTELVPRPDWGGGLYGRKSDRVFSKYFFMGDAGGWVVSTKDGRRYHYGRQSTSRTESARGVFSWHLDRIEDANGNYLAISYQRDRGRLYPQKVSYTGHGPTETAPSNHVRFILENRPDEVCSARSGEVVATAKRLAVIEVYAGDRLCRRYRLEYEQGLSSNRSRLKQVVQYGSDGVSPLPPIVVDWHDGGDGGFAAPVQSSRTINYRDTADVQEKVALADVNGDARADIVIVRGGRVFHRISNGDGTFDEADPKSIYQIGRLIGHADLNGDGLSDMVGYGRSWSGEVPYLYVNFGNGDGTYRGPVISRMPGTLHEAPTRLRSEPGSWDLPYDPEEDLKLRCEVYLADVNGDGLSDLSFRYGAFFDHKLSRGDGTFRAASRRFSGGGGVSLTHQDVNGDGLADFLSWQPWIGKYSYLNLNLG